MIIDCKKSYSFYFKNINNGKEQIIIDKAKAINDFKNSISLVIQRDPLKYIYQSKFDWIKFFKTKNDLLSGQDIQNAVSDVSETYTNKIDKFIQRISIKLQDKSVVTYYKRNTNKNFKGDIQSAAVVFKHSKLTKVISFLAKYYNETTLDYINRKLSDKNTEEKMLIFYNDVIYYLNKFNKRIIELALNIRQNAINECFKTPIVFKSLSFSSLNQIKIPIIDWNKNKKSEFNVFINLGTFSKDKDKNLLQIPSKYALKHHKELIKYQKGRNTSYTIVFKNDKPERIVLAIDDKEEITNDKNNHLGIDVNIKHNLFSMSNDKFIDFERNMLNDYIKFLKKLDKNKEIRKEKTGIKNQPLTKKEQRDYTYHQDKMKDMIKRKCNELVNETIKNGKDHLVIEDLKLFDKSYSKSEEFEDFKYSRLVRLLNLSNIKNILQSICNKKKIQLSIVHSHYTSQTCSICGYIDKGNRQSQELFKCLNCGHADNADHNSSINIYNRVHMNVLCDKLLTINKLGLFEPKVLKKEVIKDTLIECLYNPFNDDLLLAL